MFLLCFLCFCYRLWSPTAITRTPTPLPLFRSCGGGGGVLANCQLRQQLVNICQWQSSPLIIVSVIFYKNYDFFFLPIVVLIWIGGGELEGRGGGGEEENEFPLLPSPDKIVVFFFWWSFNYVFYLNILMGFLLFFECICFGFFW